MKGYASWEQESGKLPNGIMHNVMHHVVRHFFLADLYQQFAYAILVFSFFLLQSSSFARWLEL